MANKFYVDKKAHELFKELVKNPHSPFYNKEMKDVFIFAMALGLRMNKREKLKSKKEVAYFDVFKDNEKILIKSVATKAEKKLEILMDETKTIEVGEEFANGGIYTLYEWVFQKKKDPLKLLDEKITGLVKKK